MSFLKQIFQPCSPRLAFPEHYLRVLEKNPGPLQELFLENVETEGPFLYLEYQWRNELSHAEADTVDTRVRAYIACAIFDACIKGGAFCQPGPPHGSRPSWYLEGCPAPFSLVEARFSVANKSMYQTIGPIIPIIRTADYADILSTGFLRHMNRIKV